MLYGRVSCFGKPFWQETYKPFKDQSVKITEVAEKRISELRQGMHGKIESGCG